jgi:predicted 3-demethylubiquinone-9 3-methyltransferase (glyoxalase superfamily)
MTWVLLVVSYVAVFDEYKVTYYNSYNSEINCHTNKAVLEASFTEGESAICAMEN